MAYDIFHNYDFEGKKQTLKSLSESLELKQETSIEESYHGFFAPEEDSQLTEAYDNLPEWLIKKLNSGYLKNQLIKAGVDLKNAIYTKASPVVINKSFLYDSNKVVFLQMMIPNRFGSSYVFWVPRIQSDAQEFIGGRYRKLSNVAIDKIKEWTTEVGYIDLSDSMNRTREIHKERSELKDLYPDRDLSKAQYPKKVNVVYPKKENGMTDWDHPTSYDIEWVTHRGYDKNGYTLDPDKYVKMLNSVGLNNYSERIQKIYTSLEECRVELAALINRYTLDDMHKYDVRDGWSRSVFGLLGNHMRNFSDMCDDFARLNEQAARIVRYKSDEYAEDSMRYLFQSDGRTLTRNISELKQALRAARSLPLKQELED